MKKKLILFFFSFLLLPSHLEISNLNDIDVKKEAIRSVLSHFRGDAAEIDESDFDFLGAAAGKDSKAMIKEKTLDFLKRSNTYNNPDLDPVQILEVFFIFFFSFFRNFHFSLFPSSNFINIHRIGIRFHSQPLQFLIIHQNHQKD